MYQTKGYKSLTRLMYIQKQIPPQMRKPLPGPNTRRSPRINTTTSKAAKNDLEAELAAALAKAQTRGQIGVTTRKYSSNRGISGKLGLSHFERTGSDGFGRDNSEYGNEPEGSTAQVQEEHIERPEVQTKDEMLKWWKDYLNNRPLMRCLDDQEEDSSPGDQLFDKLFNEVFFTLEEMQNRDRNFWSKVRTELMPSEEETFIYWDGYWPWEDLDDPGHGADGLENFMQRSKNLTDLGKARRPVDGSDGRLRYVHKYS
jgi:hypothetical protein